MSDQSVTELVTRYDKLYNEDATWRNSWQEQIDYILPSCVNVLSDVVTPGAKQTRQIFDSTAIHANKLLAASLGSNLTPSNGKWAFLKVRDQRLNENKEVQDWLEWCGNAMDTARHQSNFNSASKSGYLQAGALGGFIVFCEESPLRLGSLHYKSFSIGKFVTCEDSNENTNVFFRKFDLSAWEAFKKFGDKCGEKIKKISEDKKDRDKPFPFLWCVLPKEQWKEDKRLKNQKSFSSLYINYEDKKLVSEGGYHEFPLLYPRWEKQAEENHGRGPGFDAIPDIRTLNKAVELDLRGWAKVIDPPLFVRDQGVIGTIRVTPSGINYTRGNPKDNIFTMPLGQRFDVTQIKVNELRESIRRIFYSDQLQLQETPQMTAAEVYVRYELMQRILGPTLGRFESEFLNHLIEREFGIMFRAGMFPPMPEVLKRYAGRDILDIEYEGPLARAQRLGELNALQKFMSFVGPIAQVKPEVLDNIDFDIATIETAEVVGVPSKLIRSIERRDAIRKARAEQERMMRAKQDLMAMAEGAGKAAPMLGMVQQMQQGGQPA